jgi:hypothetical protein
MLPDRVAARSAWAVWAIAALVVCVVVVHTLHGPNPDRNSVTPNFRTAARAWWAGENLYPSGVAGFLYFPQAAILYTPFTWGPVEVGEVLWRLICLALFTTGLSRMVRLVTDSPGRAPPGGSPWGLSRPGVAFFVASAACLPLALSNMRNGQFNLPLAGLMLHAAADLSLGWWWRAALWLCLMTALKPLGLAMVLLAAAIYPWTAWRLAIGLAVVAALPLLHPSPGYAAEMYRASLRTLGTASKVELGHGQDLRGILAALGVDVPLVVLTAVRLAAAPAMLALAWLARRRWGEPMGALYMLAAAGVYLTLFNPRCEGLTYAVLSPAIGLVLVAAAPPGARSRWVLVVLAVVVAIAQVFTGGPSSWLRPCAAVMFLAVLVWPVARPAVVENRPPSG